MVDQGPLASALVLVLLVFVAGPTIASQPRIFAFVLAVVRIQVSSSLAADCQMSVQKEKLRGENLLARAERKNLSHSMGEDFKESEGSVLQVVLCDMSGVRN